MTLPSRLWALAAPGILTQLNKQDHALLGGAVPSPEAAQDRAAVLQRDWDAADRAGLLKSLDWLAREGHRTEFNQVCALDREATAKLEPWDTIETAIDDKELLAKIYFTRRHRDRVGTRSLLAWDMVRLITIAGWGYLARMISEDEAWGYIVPAAQAVQRAYASWDELGKHHLLGREFWAGAWEGRFGRCFLAMFDDPASPWRTLPWSTDLTQHGITTPLQAIVMEAPPRPQPVMPRAAPPLGDDDEAPSPAAAGGAGGLSKIVGVVIGVVVVLALAGVGVALALGLFSPGGPPKIAAPATTAPAGAAAAAPSTSAPPRATAPAAAPPRPAPQPAAKPAPAQPAKKR
jgi:hypothetical protein